MDLESFKKAFRMVDPSGDLALALDKVLKALADASADANKLKLDSQRSSLSVELRLIEAQATATAATGRQSATLALKNLSELRVEALKLHNTIKQGLSTPALGDDAAAELWQKELLAWREALDDDATEALRSGHRLVPNLRKAIDEFETTFVDRAVELRDRTFSTDTLQTIEYFIDHITEDQMQDAEIQLRIDELESALGARLQVINSMIEDDLFGKPPPKEVLDAIGVYDARLKAVDEAKKQGVLSDIEGTLSELAEAIVSLDQVTQDTQSGLGFIPDPNRSLEDELEDGARETRAEARTRYLNAWTPIQEDVMKYSGFVYQKAMPSVDQGLQDDLMTQIGARYTANNKNPPDYEAAEAAAIELGRLLDLIRPLAAEDIAKIPKDALSPKQIKEKKSKQSERKKELDARVSRVDKFLRPSIRQKLGDEVVDGWHDARDNALRRWRRAGDVLDERDGALDDLELALKDIERRIGALGRERLAHLEDGGRDASVVADEAARFAKFDPHVMDDLSTETLDAVAEHIGDKANSSGLVSVMRAATIARFKLDKFEGDLSKKALPRLYKVLGRVPESHTRDNPRLKSLIRKRKIGASWYTDDDDEIVLNMPQLWTLGVGSKIMDAKARIQGQRLKQDDEVEDGFQISAPEGVEVFDQVMYHEIGHAIDAKVRFMDRRGGEAGLGGWRHESVLQVADAIVNRKGLSERFPTVAAAVLRAYVLGVLQGAAKPEAALESGKLSASRNGDTYNRDQLLESEAVLQASTDRTHLEDNEWRPDEVGQAQEELKKMLCKAPLSMSMDAAMALSKRLIPAGAPPTETVEQAVDAFLADFHVPELVTAPDTTPWKAIAKDPAVVLAKKMRVDGDNGLWDKGRAGATEANIGGRVYQQAYSRDSEWWSYSFAARNKGVSAYQFRSPAEWFSEAYAAYYQERLPKAHPLYDWLAEQDA